MRLEKFRRKSVNLLQESGKTDKNKSTEDVETDIMKLTTSETRRNIGMVVIRVICCFMSFCIKCLGSVTHFLDPKFFEENRKSGCFETDEFWLPIKDISVSSTAQSTSLTSVSIPRTDEMIVSLTCKFD